MTHSGPESNAVPEGYEGYKPPVATPPPAAPAPYPGQQHQNYPAPPPPYPGQQHQSYPPPPPYQQPPATGQVGGYLQPKSKLTAGLLGIFLGGFGIHRFYLGHTKIGLIQLALTVVLSLFGFGIVGLWGVVEGIMILAGASLFRADARGIPLRG